MNIKANEVKLIKEQSGVVTLDEPKVNLEGALNE